MNALAAALACTPAPQLRASSVVRLAAEIAPQFGDLLLGVDESPCRISVTGCEIPRFVGKFVACHRIALQPPIFDISSLTLPVPEPAPDTAPLPRRPLLAAESLFAKQTLAFTAKLIEKPAALPDVTGLAAPSPAPAFTPVVPGEPRCASRTSEPANIAPLPDPPPRPPAIHELTLRIPVDRPQSPGQNVEVRIAERGGEIHVAVRAGEPTIIESLRQNLPALAAGLETAGYRSEFRLPGSPEMQEKKRREPPRPRPPAVRRTGETKWHPPFSL